jgi:hypothetical protein
MNWKKFALFLALIIIPPFLGAKYFALNFEPAQRFSPAAIIINSRKSLPEQPYSLYATIALAIFGLCLVVFFFLLLLRGINRSKARRSNHAKFPWWGWLAGILLVIFWALAWYRPSAVNFFTYLSFSALWFCYIILINAATYRRSGHSMLTHDFRFLCLLFLISIPFWWYFEYLNRYVFNWYYLYEESSAPTKYLLFGTMAFGTVLPAVLSTRDFILTFPSFNYSFERMVKLSTPRPKLFAGALLILSTLCLGSIGIWPQYLFIFLWIAPLFILVSLQALWGQNHVFSPTAKGNYTLILASALAALICGSVWELWNYRSIPQWIYSVPWVNGLKLFEMPMIGYLGYLPFGMECLAVSELLAIHYKKL